MKIHEIIPDYEVLLALEAEEIGGVVLECLIDLQGSARSQINRYNFTSPQTVIQYPREQQDALCRALMEGWMWLEREGLIAPAPGATGDFFFVTRRGERVNDRKGLKAYVHASISPRKLLHPKIVINTWSAFIRGEYGMAVFQAFKQVELSVREKCGFGQ